MINGGAPHTVSAALLQSYLLEQMQLQGWQLLTLGYGADRSQIIEVRGADGVTRTITVSPAQPDS